MSSAVGYLFVLVPVIGIAYVVWAYGKKNAEKQARSQERMAALVGISKHAGATPGAARKEHTAAVGASKPADFSAAAAAAAVVARRERFLSQSETLLYYVLKAGLPGHEVFPRVRLASLLGAPEHASGQALELHQRIARHDLDFVVCDKSMRVIAAIQLNGHAPIQGKELVSQWLNAAGIRLVIVRPDAPPRREQVHALIYGPSA